MVKIISVLLVADISTMSTCQQISKFFFQNNSILVWETAKKTLPWFFRHLAKLKIYHRNEYTKLNNYLLLF
jgi:hypothetical protein